MGNNMDTIHNIFHSVSYKQNLPYTSTKINNYVLFSSPTLRDVVSVYTYLFEKKC